MSYLFALAIFSCEAYGFHGFFAFLRKKHRVQKGMLCCHNNSFMAVLHLQYILNYKTNQIKRQVLFFICAFLVVNSII